MGARSGSSNTTSRRRLRFPPRTPSRIGNESSRETTLLYFAYTARIAPDQMADVCPEAHFEFIAHLPEWGLEFPIDGNGWGGGLPTATPVAGSTVWGAVYSIPDGTIDQLDAIERKEGRTSTVIEAIDRMGRRHRVTTHLAETRTPAALDPSVEYVSIMLDGSRHWSLPAGWIAGLEEYLDAGI